MSDDDRDRLVRKLAEDLVISEAEQAAAGLRRLTVLHDLADGQEAERAELLDFVDDRDEILDSLRPEAALARQVQARNDALRVREA